MHSPLLSQVQQISKILAFAAIRTNSNRGTLSLAVWAGTLEVALVENLLDVRMGILMHKKTWKDEKYRLEDTEDSRGIHDVRLDDTNIV